jgi:uncharacterized protein (TIGR02145 family)
MKILLGIIVLIVMAATSFAGDCGNANGDQAVNLLDVSFIINSLYRGGTLPNPIQSADVNNDGKMNLLDVSYIINYLYRQGPAPNCPTFYLAPDTTKIIPADSVNAIVTCDTLGKIVLNGLSSYGQHASVGDFIIGQNEATAPDGFLRKVTSKTVRGDSVILETDEAALADAFKSMHISETHQLRPSDVRSSKMLKGSSLKSNSNSDIFTVGLDCVFYDQDGNPETDNDQIKLSGEYNFTAALFANIEISWFSLKKFETGIQTNQNANVDVTANLQWSFDQEQKFDLAEFKLGAIPVGGVVWLVPTLTVRAYLHGDLTITFETGISYTQELRYGFGYANDAFYDINECTKSFTYTPPQFTAEFNFEPGVSLDASCLLYGVAGPYMGGKAGFHFQSVLRNDPCGIDLDFNLNAILYAVVGVKCNILRLDYNRDYQLFTHPIGEWTFPLSGSGTIVIDPEPNSINASWSITGPCDYSASGNGDKTFTYRDLGDYTITWGTVPDWTTPANSTQTLGSGQTLTFTGTYAEIMEMPTITTVAISAITQTTAECGGTISADGGAPVTARGVCWSINPTPTISDNITTDGTGTGSFTSSLTGLTENTTYYVRAYATNGAGTGYGDEKTFKTSSYSGTVTDIDGNVYHTITIGTQTWMVENLKVTHYRNGDGIPNITDDTVWDGLTTGAYCEYNNDINNVATYGRLYNWYAVDDSRNIAPAGWHVPSDAEWQTLVDYLGGSSVAGGKMKETGYTHWLSPNTGATNESGFSGLPGGWRSDPGTCSNIDYYANFWSSTEDYSSVAWSRSLIYNDSVVYHRIYDKETGISVRCVKDAPVTVTDIDGNVYETVTIGTQVWMAENLKVTHYRNGDLIPNVTDNATWAGLTSGAYCEYNNDPNNVATYGRLYNWYSANDSRNIAPAGWHVPSDEEWQVLADYLGGEGVAGGKMKEAGTAHWYTPNAGATNESGFTGLPGGFRVSGNYMNIGNYACFWSTTEDISGYAWGLGLSYMMEQAARWYDNNDKEIGYSVRCVKDVEGNMVTDIDGNVYETVTIGSQVWMAENLKVTHYRNGDAIPNVTDGTTWSESSSGAYCEYNNDINNVATYGRLYNWFAINDSRNIAPAGWHVPTDAEWQTLVDYLGGNTVAGGKLKESGTSHWYSPNTGATNESGFSGLPGGCRTNYGNYGSIGTYAFFWSATEDNSNYAWYCYLNCSNSEVYRVNSNKHYGFSVRCVKD